MDSIRALKAGLLLSGGIDSTAIAYWTRPRVGITVHYGQVSASAEIDATSQVCISIGIRHRVVEVDCSDLGCGDLAAKKRSKLGKVSEWWPFRNQLLITLAGMVAVQEDLSEIWIGTVKTDKIHSDGRPEFRESIDHLMKRQEGSVRVRAPASNLTSVELVRRSKVPKGILGWSHSCHRSNFACAKCRGCHKRATVMEELDWDTA